MLTKKTALLCLLLLWVNCLWIVQAQAGQTGSTSLQSLQLPIRMLVPKRTVTIAQAIRYWLAPTPYQLQIPADSDAQTIASQNLPMEANSGKISTIAAAINRIIGSNYHLLINPSEHILSFRRSC